MTLTGRQYPITAGEFEATVVAVGGGLRRFAHRGVDITCTYDDDELPPKGCGAVLVPWPNRLRGGRYTFDGREHQLALTEPSARNAIHGLGRWARWTAVRHEESAVTMVLDLVPQTGWPFEVSVEVTYALDAQSGLRVSTRALNHGTVRAPFGAGFHPYLCCGPTPLSDVALTVPASQRLVVDEAQVPVGTQSVERTEYDLRRGRALGKLRLDDGFTDLPAGGAAVEFRAGRSGARLWFDETFRYVQVFTVEAFPGADCAGVAVEPMTCAPDAFNSGAGLIVLEPKTEWSGSWGITPL